MTLDDDTDDHDTRDEDENHVDDAKDSRLPLDCDDTRLTVPAAGPLLAGFGEGSPSGPSLDGSAQAQRPPRRH